MRKDLNGIWRDLDYSVFKTRLGALTYFVVNTHDREARKRTLSELKMICLALNTWG